MKNTIRNILLSLLFLFVSLACGATTPTMDVTVSNATGKVAYKGTTNANGTFATGNLEAGNYVVQFNSKSAAVKGSKFGIAVSAGKNSFSADAVSGEKFAANGVAMKVVLEGGTKITGQVAGSLAATKVVTTAGASTGSQSGTKVKVINGKRYVWVTPQKSSLEGGHWVEESAAANAQSETVRQPSPPPRPAGRMGY